MAKDMMYICTCLACGWMGSNRELDSKIIKTMIIVEIEGEEPKQKHGRQKQELCPECMSDNITYGHFNFCNLLTAIAHMQKEVQ